MSKNNNKIENCKIFCFLEKNKESYAVINIEGKDFLINTKEFDKQFNKGDIIPVSVIDYNRGLASYKQAIQLQKLKDILNLKLTGKVFENCSLTVSEKYFSCYIEELQQNVTIKKYNPKLSIEHANISIDKALLYNNKLQTYGTIVESEVPQSLELEIIESKGLFYTLIHKNYNKMFLLENRDQEYKIGDIIKCYVMSIDNNNIVVSDQLSDYSDIELNEIYETTIKKQYKNLIIVDINGKDGYVGQQEFIWNKSQLKDFNPEIGEKIKCKVIKKHKFAIELSIKKATENPYKEMQNHYKIGDIINITINSNVKSKKNVFFGIFQKTLNNNLGPEYMDVVMKLSELSTSEENLKNTLTDLKKKASIPVVIRSISNNSIGISARALMSESLKSNMYYKAKLIKNYEKFSIMSVSGFYCKVMQNLDPTNLYYKIKKSDQHIAGQLPIFTVVNNHKTTNKLEDNSTDLFNFFKNNI